MRLALAVSVLLKDIQSVVVLEVGTVTYVVSLGLHTFGPGYT